MELIYAAVALFGIAALIGIYLITFVLQTKHPPKIAAVIHGALAATAIALLIIHKINTGADILKINIIFSATAIIGFLMFARHLMARTIPKTLAVVHALLAVAGFIYLLVYAFSK
jgi:hypothetical protein